MVGAGPEGCRGKELAQLWKGTQKVLLLYGLIDVFKVHIVWLEGHVAFFQSMSGDGTQSL